MKGMIKLWHNECIKLTKQVANRVIIIIALALSVILPLLSTALFAMQSYDRYADAEMYFENAESTNDDMDRINSLSVS